LSTEITRIEVEQTAGEIGALLREIELIKTRMPLRNHRLRRNEEVVFLRLTDLNAMPTYVPVAEVDFAQTVGLYGPFAAKSQAKSALNALAADYELCWHVIAGKPTGGPCFGRQLHRCRGHCVGEETLIQHNLRLVEALAEKRLPEWPFDGRAVYRETNPETGIEEVQVFDRWCLVGSARSDDELAELLDAKPQPFDVDVFRVIRKRVEFFTGIGKA
jgi:DNA polymerase-3 subunit epsilon